MKWRMEYSHPLSIVNDIEREEIKSPTKEEIVAYQKRMEE